MKRHKGRKGGAMSGFVKSIALTAAIATAIIFAAVAAHAGTVKEIFEKYQLIGTFAWNCAKPANANDNWWYVNRLLDDKHVQRDLMHGPSTRSAVIMIDSAIELKPDEIRVTGMRDGEIAVDNVWHIEKSRMQTWQGIGDTKGKVADGKYVQTGKAMPWLNRCGS
jgi:hypothetical protein